MPGFWITTEYSLSMMEKKSGYYSCLSSLCINSGRHHTVYHKEGVRERRLKYSTFLVLLANKTFFISLLSSIFVFL